MIDSSFPRQKLPYKKKNKDWRKRTIDWGDKRSYIWNSSIRKSFYNKKINYDLWNGKLHIEDMKMVLNPNDKDDYIPQQIQHYPIMNNTLNVLIGEESDKDYEYSIRVSNYDAITEKEESLTSEIQNRILQIIQSQSQSEEEVKEKLKGIEKYAKYEHQDLRELRANFIMNHYTKVLDFKLKLNQGWKDALISGEEIYQFDIVHGEPVFEKLNPRKVHVLKHGYSSRIEDADIILIDDYWNPGRIIDVYYDQLSSEDIDWLEQYDATSASVDDMQNYNDNFNFVNVTSLDGEYSESNGAVFGGYANGSMGAGYYDSNGNIRVMRMYWKSKKMIKRVKRYDPQTGEEFFDFESETYVPNKMMGEEVEDYWINESWSGAKIGPHIYVDMKPRPVQYSRMSNPSKCHHGIIGQIYNTNEGPAVSLIDRIKPTQYLYDAVKHNLLKLINRNYGTIIELDLAKMPANYTVDKWTYYLKEDGISVIDSFKEGNKGQSTGKLAGHFNTTGKKIDLSVAADIQMYINVLDYLKTSMDDLSGISPQRKGNISNRETVGGVERSVVQSSYITQELFAIHDNVKKRCLECLLETAKIALKGNKKKLQFISSDFANQIFELDGDEFAECDFDIIVDDEVNVSQLRQKLEGLSQAGLQNQLTTFSTVMQIMRGAPLSSIMRKIEKDEEESKLSKQEELKARQEEVMQTLKQKAESEQAERDLKSAMNTENNQTKLIIANMQADMTPEEIEPDTSLQDELAVKKLQLEGLKRTDAKSLNNEKLKLEIKKLEETIRSNKEKESIAKSKPKTTIKK